MTEGEVEGEGEGEKEVVVVQENAAMYDQENHYISLSGAWKKLGLYRISDRYSDFRKLVKGMKLPDIKETKAAFCGRILDECGKQSIAFPPEFLAITRRLRKGSPNAAFFTVAEQIAEENRRRGTL